MFPVIRKIVVIKAEETYTPLILAKWFNGGRYEWSCLNRMMCVTEGVLLNTIMESKNPPFTTAAWAKAKKEPTAEMAISLVKKAIKNAATVEDLLLLNKPDRLQLTARVYTCEGGWPVTDSKYIWSGNDLMEWAEHAKRTFGESVNGVLDFNKNDFLLPSDFPNEMLLAYGKDQYVKSISMVGCQPTEISFTSSETEGPWVALRISLNEYKNLLMHCNCVKLFQGLRPVSAASKEGPYNAIVRATFRKEPGYDYVVSGGKRVKDCAKYAKRFKDLKTAERVAKQFNEKLGARGFHFEAVIID